MRNDATHIPEPADDLERLYIEFAHILREHIDAQVRTHGIPLRQREHITFLDGGALTTVTEQYRDFWSVIAPQHQHLGPWENPEVQACFDQHWDAMLREVVQAEDPYLAQWPVSECVIWCGRILASPLLLALEATTSADDAEVSACDDATILGQYRRLRELWQSPRTHFTVTAPLPFLTTTFPAPQHIQLGPYCVLMPLLPAEKTRLWQKIDYPTEMEPLTRSLLAAHSGISLEHLWNAQWCLRAQVSWPRSETSAAEQMNGETIAIVMALRLLKRGLLRLPFIYYEAAEGTTLHPGMLARNSPELGMEHLPEPPYSLTVDDVPLLQHVLEGVRLALQPADPAGLNLALSRFNLAATRTSEEDVLIDLAIALECTLLHQQRDELKYRLALRGAALLAPDRAPSQTKDMLSLLYDARSSIVHDGKRLSELSKIWRKLRGVQQSHDFAVRCQDVVRDVLRAYALHRGEGRDLRTVEELLDDRIIAGITRR